MRLASHSRLLVWVQDAWLESSPDLHATLDLLADTKIRPLGLARGIAATDTRRAERWRWPAPGPRLY